MKRERRKVREDRQGGEKERHARKGRERKVRDDE